MNGRIVVIGSGELGDSMRATHRRAIEESDVKSVTIIDTPYGFQENADQLTERIAAHFRKGFGLKPIIASLRRPGDDPSAFCNEIDAAEMIFAGPGSPSYALRAWAGLEMGDRLARALDRGGVVTMASAAAVTLGSSAIPVYEIYKVGTDLHWLPGIDLLGQFGMKATVVPHWNNREGGFHDTSHCFLGERRFQGMVELLGPEVSVIGVDEHTSLTIDPLTWGCVVQGVGSATLNGLAITDGATLGVPGSRPPLPPLPVAADRPSTGETDQLIEALVDTRHRARLRGDFKESDRIRSLLVGFEVEIHDEPDGSTWNRRD